jgi:hypothetical protein
MVNMIGVFMISGAAVATFTALGFYVTAAVFAGMPIGAVVLSLGRNKTTVHLWPILESVVDWHKVDDILKTETSPN